MFVIRFIQWLFGYVKFSGTTVNFEMFINIAASEGINLWNTKANGKSINGFISRSQYKLIRPIAYRSGTKIRIEKKYGLPFLFHKLFRRKGIFIGIIFFFVFMMVMSKFIWVVEIHPSDDIDIQKVEATLYQAGLKPGVSRSSLDTEILERKIMLTAPEISWISINLTGSVAEVEISVTDNPPEMQQINREDTSVLIASKAGQVIRNEVYSGTAMVNNGDVVEKGQLLVNSNFESDLGEIIQTSASGKVFAMVRDTMQVEVPFDQIISTPTSDTVKRRQLDFFNLNIPLSLTSVPAGKATVSITEKPLKLLGRQLPISITEETWTKYDEVDVRLTEEEAYNKAKEILNTKLDDKIAENDATILQCDESIIVDPDKLILSASVLSQENIAVRYNYPSQEDIPSNEE